MNPTILEPTASRMLPPLNDENRAFFTGGANGRLLIQHCASCDRWIHPPSSVCPACGGPPEAKPVSGRGTVFTYTLNLQKFHPEHETPNLIAIVVLDEQDDLRIVTNIVGAELDDVSIGMPVEVAFERHGEIFYPVFEPRRSAP